MAERVERKIKRVGAEAGYATLRSLFECPVLPDFRAEVAARRRRAFPAAVEQVEDGWRTVGDRETGWGTVGDRRREELPGERGSGPRATNPVEGVAERPGAGAFASVLGCPRDDFSEIGG